MKIVTVNLCVKQLKAMALLIKLGMFNNRSELVRSAVHHLLVQHEREDREGFAVKVLDRDDTKDEINRHHLNIATLNLPHLFVSAIESLVLERKYESRSDFIRVAVDLFVLNEMRLSEYLVRKTNEMKELRIDFRVRTIESAQTTPKKIDMRSIRNGWN